MSTAIADPETEVQEKIWDEQETTCCVVGGGPAGMMLGLLLARKGVRVTVLEAHKDFEREFRGDTIHPSVLQVLDEIGLAERLHELRFTKIYGPTLRAANTNFNPVDLRTIKTKFPYIMLLPQTKFLEFIAKEARNYPEFRLIMTANVVSLIEEDGCVRGVTYQGLEGLHQIRALLTVGGDGRFSKVRHLAGFEPIKTSPPMDILWFSLPHLPEDTEHVDRVLGGFAMGRVLVVFDRDDYWQIGYVFPKGGYQQLRAEGLGALRKSVAQIEPRLTQHVQALMDWRQCSLLSVESSRCPRWYKPGLLVIGDAAHVMSPVGGVGINYAIMDAVAASNLLSAPLRSGRVSVSDLAKVQKKREWPTRVIQFIQSFLQKRVIASAFRARPGAGIPWPVRLLFRLPIVRNIPARILGIGIGPEHVQD